jgi:hypothetical protein
MSIYSGASLSPATGIFEYTQTAKFATAFEVFNAGKMAPGGRFPRRAPYYFDTLSVDS